MNGSWHIITMSGGLTVPAGPVGAIDQLPWQTSPLLLAQADMATAFTPVTKFFESILSQLGTFLPSLLGAVAILIVGWIVATVLASATKGLLSRTNIDNQLASWIVGQRPGATKPPIEQWAATGVYWVVMIFVIVAFLSALQLNVVSTPLNTFLDKIFDYLPRVGGAAVLLGIAWLLATLAKALLTRLLQPFNLDDRLAEQTGRPPGDSPFLLNETLGNALYWFIFLFFLPSVLSTLELQGALTPVQNLLDQILSALPKILTATIIGAIGWLIARIVRGIVTNLLAATGTDQLGRKMGLTASEGGMSLSGLIGTIVYVLVLIPTAIAALNALEIQAISAPAVSMLQQILNTLPQIFTAALIFAVFYVIGQFISELVTNILTSVGFNNLFQWLGLPSSMPAASSEDDEDPRSGQKTVIQTPAKTPSEIAGIVALVGIMLFAAVAATEVLQLAVLTQIAQGILAGSGGVLVGLLVFGVGLYLANLAFNLIAASGGGQAKILGNAARISIIALAGAMGLQQMGIAPDIVNLAFGLLLGGVAVAIALAFGLGGRDVAAEQLRQWLASFKDTK